MNKAFTKESDDEWELVPDLKDPLPPGVKNYVTPRGAEALKRTLAELRDRRGPVLQVLNQGADARAGHSTLPPRQQLDEIDRRVHFFAERVRTMIVVDSANQDASVVRFGARVSVEDAEGETAEYAIVGVDEADPSDGKISFLSPIAKALMGRREGDEVLVQLPGGERSLEIAEIQY